MKSLITRKEFSNMYDYIAQRLLDQNQFAGPWFGGMNYFSMNEPEIVSLMR